MLASKVVHSVSTPSTIQNAVHHARSSLFRFPSSSKTNSSSSSSYMDRPSLVAAARSRDSPEDEKPRKGKKAFPTEQRNLLGSLNFEQRDAATDPCHAIYVKAGPGTGKTHMLAARVQRHLQQQQQQQQRRGILVFTFTNQAADEIKERIQASCGDASKSVVATTFHSFCVHILRSKDYNITSLNTGHTKDFVVFDAEDAEDALRAALGRHQMIGNASLKTIDQLAKTLKAAFDVVKNLRPTTFNIDMAPVFSEALGRNMTTLDSTIKDKHVLKLDPNTLAELFELYQRELIDNNAVDFGDQLSLAVALLQQLPFVCEEYNRKFAGVLVDEFQDTNPPQFALARLLKGREGSLLAVGDDNQMIYGWRGTDATVMGQNFQTHWPDRSLKTLSKNYRSPQAVLDASSAVLCHGGAPPNHQPLQACDPNKPGGVYFVAVQKPIEEAFTAMLIIKNMLSTGTRLSDIAVLYRTNFQAEEISRLLKAAGIPFINLAKDTTWENKVVKTCMSFLALATDPVPQETPPGDIDSHLGMIIKTLERDLGGKAKDALKDVCLQRSVSMNSLLFGDILNVWIARDKLMRVLAELDKLGSDKMWPNFKNKNRKDVTEIKQQLQEDVSVLLSSNANIPELTAADLPGITAPVLMSVNKLRQLLVLSRSTARFGEVQDAISAFLCASAFHLSMVDSGERHNYIKRLLKVAEHHAGRAHASSLDEAPTEGCCQKAESPDDPELQRLKSFSRWVAYLKTQKDRLQKDPGECVRLLTMHSSKGTEFSCVILLGFKEGLIPMHSSKLKVQQGKRLPTNVDEERRLAYVAMTRPKSKLFILGPVHGMPQVSGTPSPFLSTLQTLEQAGTVQFTTYLELSNQASSKDL